MDIKVLREPRYIASENEALEEEKQQLLKTMGASSSALIQRIDNTIKKNELRSKQIMEIIESIPDEELKTIIHLYQSGKTWEQVNVRVYGYSGQACRKRAERYLEKIDFV